MPSKGDYEHWPADHDDELFSESAVASPGYGSHNGLHRYTYERADTPKSKSTSAAAQAAPAYSAYPAAAGVAYAPAAYAYAPQYFYAAAPAYYAPVAAASPSYQAYQPTGPVHDGKPAKKKTKTFHWQGRTRAEVEEDDMRMAASQGAYDKRKMDPVGLNEDQMIWCVEGNGETVLRTYATVKQFQGEWKQDPRFVESWYFVRSS